MKKRIVIIGDMHCGHQAGLTPPGWQYGPPWPENRFYQEKRKKYAHLQQTMWQIVEDIARDLQPTDPNMELDLVLNGDICDGKGRKNAGKELITTEMDEQLEFAVQAVRLFKPSKIYMTVGTPYHTGEEDDWERQLATKVNADELKDMLWLNVNGRIFNIRHKTSRSVIPHGRATALLRQRLWEVLWADWEERKAASILIRGHVHYHTYAGGPDHLVMSCPALQVYSEYGVRQCEGIIHAGVVWFDVEEDGSYIWRNKIIKGKMFKSDPILV